MGKVLIIGATGQLGLTVLKQLLATEYQCVALIRKTSKFNGPISTHLELREGDLADLASLEKACADVEFVITTASSIVPRAGDKFGVNEVENYKNLLKACKLHHVKHLVYISAFSSPFETNFQVPEYQVKRQIEQLILNSGTPFTIFRGAAFMDIYFAVMGSRLAIEAVTQPTLLRGFWLTDLYVKLTNGILENYGIAILPGNGKTLHPFICIQDVAVFMTKALRIPSALNRIIELGGPETLSWANVADIYGEILGRKVRKLNLPNLLFIILKTLLGPFSPAGENIMSLLYFLGRYDLNLEMKAVCEEFDVKLTNTREYLLERLRASN